MSTRAFFAVWPEPAWCEGLLAAIAPIRGETGRWLAMSDLHVTLRFLGTVDAVPLAALQRAVAAIRWQPFSLHFERVEWWPQAQALVAVAIEAPPAAVRLVEALTAAASELGIEVDPQRFRPHITLARRAEQAERALSWRPPLVLSAREFGLARSESGPAGARYRVLEYWSAFRGGEG